jgi:hypothetical protein
MLRGGDSTAAYVSRGSFPILIVQVGHYFLRIGIVVLGFYITF